MENNHSFRKFINTEAKVIEISKWIAGERLGHDPGLDYISKWVEDHAKELRDAWDKSKCKTCQKDCRHNLKAYCEDYAQEIMPENGKQSP